MFWKKKKYVKANGQKKKYKWTNNDLQNTTHILITLFVFVCA
jgi:hypothetical protein